MAKSKSDKKQELVTFLLDRGLAEEKKGYGHASAEQVADALISSGWIK